MRTVQEREARAFAEPKENWITHEELQALLRLLYPTLSSGRDYLVGMAIDENGPISDAAIVRWSADVPEPTDSVLREVKRLRLVDARRSLTAGNARFERDRLLAEADVAVSLALDDGDTNRVALLGAYRKALRALPDQPGFPDAVAWPVKP